MEHKEKFDYFLIKCEFKLVFNDYEYSPFVTSKSSDNKTAIPLKNFLEKVIDDSKDEGYTLNHIAEMHFITIANKWICRIISI